MYDCTMFHVYMCECLTMETLICSWGSTHLVCWKKGETAELNYCTWIFAIASDSWNSKPVVSPDSLGQPRNPQDSFFGFSTLLINTSIYSYSCCVLCVMYCWYWYWVLPGWSQPYSILLYSVERPPSSIYHLPSVFLNGCPLKANLSTDCGTGIGLNININLRHPRISSIAPSYSPLTRQRLAEES